MPLAFTSAPRATYIFRLLAGLTLFALLLLVGSEDTRIMAWLAQPWQQTTGPASSSQAAHALSVVGKAPLIARLLYGLLYVGLCVTLLSVLLWSRRRLRVVLLIYGAGLVLCGVLLLAKLNGHTPWIYQLGRNLLMFLVSPLPVMVLAPLLYWYYPDSEKAAETRN